MFRRVHLIAGVSAVVISALPAVADGPSGGAAWSGFYVGGNVGAAWGDSDWFLPFGLGGTAISIDTSGIVGGLHAGYGHAMGDWVVSGEVTWRTGDLSGDGTKAAPAISCRTGLVICRVTDVDDITTAELKLGKSMGDWLISAHGGYAGAEIGTDGVVVATGLPNYGDSVWHDGWVVGASAEVKIAPHLSFGVDYSRIALNDERHAQSFGAGNARDVELELDIVQARLSYHF